MGFGTIFTTLTFLLVFAGMVVLVVATQHTLTASATEMRQQQERIQQQARTDITIQNTVLQGPTEIGWTITYADEYAQGTFDDATTTQDRIVLGTANTGTYTSPVYDTGHQSNYTTLTWTAIIPLGASIAFQVRSANTIQDLESAPFIGPDGTPATNYTVTATPLHTNNQETRYVQWRATLERTADTPQLISTTLGVERNTNHVFINITNTGQTKIRFEETDIYVDGVRIPRTTAHRVIQTTPFLDERLWNPTQTITYVVFDTGTITLQNSRAQASTTI